MPQLPDPYVAILGVTQKSHIDQIIQAVPDHALHRFAAGIFLAPRMLQDGTDHSSGHSLDQVRAFLSYDHPRVLKIVCFTSQDPNFAPAAIALSELLAPARLNFQLNINPILPNPISLEVYRKKYPDTEVIIRIGRRALQELGDPRHFVTVLRECFAGLVDHLLLDPSGARDTPLNPIELAAYLKAAQDAGLWDVFRFGVAGGLSVFTLRQLARPLLKKFDPYLSLSTQLEEGAGPDAAVQYVQRCYHVIALASKQAAKSKVS